MRRIFYLITELDVGGAEKSLYELATRLDRQRFEPIVGCLTGRGEIGEWLEKAGVEVTYVDMKSWCDVAGWLRLRKALKVHRPHVLHTFLFHANLAGRLAAIKSSVKRVICSVRVEEPRRSHLWTGRLTRGLVDVVTCVSESAARYTHKHVRVPDEKLVVIHNGIDPTRCDMPVMAPPDRWRLPADGPVIASIGRLDEQKNPFLMLRAARLVAKEIPEAVFAFAGTGPLEADCRAEADRLRLKERVRWLGWVEDTRPLLARMDLLALSSKWEGMPNVVLEAMACRKPVVATAVGGCPEMLGNGETGLLVPAGDAKALAERILQLLRDPDLRERFGRAARARVEQQFSIKAMIEANEGLYEIPNT